ncbi:hypothetical protein [Streptomyces sp. SA15]|uniref:hypothetical protein n=1 Tax=Streptomyces sp. SA15 TaxID=934019 RepID=UPI0011815032|nr:hypothetical protein [Streptomyces sp. SA15]
MTSRPSSLAVKAPAALLGLLTGGAAGFLLTAGGAAYVAHALGRTVDASGASRVAFIAVPVICAVWGAVVAVRRAAR